MNSQDSTERLTQRLNLFNLPSAIIRTIFLLYCTPCHTFRTCKEAGCGVSTPLVLGSICADWRKVSLETPSLWKWISLRVSPARYDAQVELLREWLMRTKDEPLSIVIRPSSGYGNYRAPIPVSLFQHLVEYSMQWQFLDIYSPDECTQILNKARGRTPILESVTINTSGEIRKGFQTTFLDVCPNLRALSVSGTINIGMNVGQPWENLTSFTYKTFQSSTIMASFLQKAHNVESFRFSSNKLVSNAATIDDVPSPVILPKLTSLALDGCTDFDILSVMTVPSLQRLSIIKSSTSTLQPVRDMLVRSKCNLKALGVAFANTAINFMELRNLLLESDTIARLYISSSVASKDFKVITRNLPNALDPSLRHEQSNEIPRVNEILVPNLQILYYSTVDPIRSQAMIDMIKTRWRGYNIQEPDFELPSGAWAKLRIVRFRKAKQYPMLEQLKEEIAEGLEVTYDLPYKGEPFE